MPVKLLTPEFRVSYPHVFSPYQFPGQKDSNYSLAMLFDKKTDLSAFKGAIKTCIEEKWPNPDKRPAKLQLPVRDGDKEKPDMDGYAGAYFVSAKTAAKNKVLVLDRQKEEILDQAEFYAGCYARASVTFYAWTFADKAGVSVALNGVQKLRDGARFGSGGVSASEFDELPEETPSSEKDFFEV